MDWFKLLQLAGAIALLGAALGAGIGSLWYTVRSKENKLLKEENNSCDARLKEAFAAIHKLEGQMQVIKEIPLQQIATNLAAIAGTNSEILATLNKSALIAETDKNALLPDTQIINEQKVEHQVIDRRKK